jgi:hypothetical protein
MPAPKFPRKFSTERNSVPQIRNVSPLPLNGYEKAPGNAVKKFSFSDPCRMSCTFNATHSPAHFRQNQPVRVPPGRFVTHSSQ